MVTSVPCNFQLHVCAHVHVNVFSGACMSMYMYSACGACGKVRTKQVDKLNSPHCDQFHYYSAMYTDGVTFVHIYIDVSSTASLIGINQGPVSEFA